MRRPWDAIAWWELRRIPYNLVLLLAGGISGFTILFVGSRYVNTGEDVIEPMAIFAGVVVFGIAANLCYTLGWITELLWSKGDTSRTETLRPQVFRAGLIFSAGLTLLPALLVPLLWALCGFRHGP